MDFFSLKLKILSFFVKKPTREFTWTVEDFELAKKWAKSKPHPFKSNKTLWDFCSVKGDSVDTVHNINKFISL